MNKGSIKILIATNLVVENTPFELYDSCIQFAMFTSISDIDIQSMQYKKNRAKCNLNTITPEMKS